MSITPINPGEFNAITMEIIGIVVCFKVAFYFSLKIVDNKHMELKKGLKPLPLSKV